MTNDKSMHELRDEKFSRPALRLAVPGIQAPRRATDGSELPSARLISASVHNDVDAPSNMFTHLLMLMGQFLDHDLTRTAASTLATGENAVGMLCPNSSHKTNLDCIPLHVTADKRGPESSGPDLLVFQAHILPVVCLTFSQRVFQ